MTQKFDHFVNFVSTKRASFWRKTPVMSQKGVKECSAGFQPAEGLLQTKSLPSSTCRQDAGATISSRLLSPARRFAPETSSNPQAERPSHDEVQGRIAALKLK